MPNRFNQLIEPNKYVSQYVPLPLDFINQQGAMKQKEHDATLADIGATKDILDVKADPHREPVKNELLSAYNNQINELADEYLKTDNASEVTNKLNKLKRDWKADPIRVGLESSAANYDAYLKDYRENLKSGKLDPTIKGGYDTYAEDSPVDENGKFKSFVHEGLWTAEDLDAGAKKVMGTIAADGSDFKGMITDPKTGELIIDRQGAYWGQTSGGEGVGPSKVIKLANMKADPFLRSNEGRYFIDQQLGQHISYRDLDDKTKEELQKRASQYLVQSAAQQVGWRSKSGNEAHFAPMDIRKPVDPNAGQQKFTSESGSTQGVGGWTKAAGLDTYFNEDGSVKAGGSKDAIIFKDGTKIEEQDYPDYNSYWNARSAQIAKGNKVEKEGSMYNTGSANKQIIEGQQALYKKTSALGINVHRPDGTVDAEATKEAAKNYFSALATYSDHAVSLKDKEIVDNISNDYFGKTSNISNMQIYEQGNPDSKGKYETTEKKAKFKDSRVVALDYSASQPGAIKFVAPEGEYGDKPFTAITRDITLANQMKPIQELTVKSLEGARTGQKDVTARNFMFHMEGDIVKDSKGGSQTFHMGNKIPVASSVDNDGTLYVSLLDNSSGSPVIQVLKQSKTGPLELKSLDEVQQDKTGEIFNTGGALSQYQKQTTSQTLPTTEYQEGE